MRLDYFARNDHKSLYSIILAIMHYITSRGVYDKFIGRS
jgi:hypothetical protein